MANKTIYFSDEELWARAKELAGKTGLSAVIQGAIEDFVRREEAREEGFTLHRLDVGFRFDANTGQEGFTECLTFNGRLLLVHAAHMIASENSEDHAHLSGGDLTPPGDRYDVEIHVYLTRARKLIVLVDEIGEGGAATYYAIHDSLKSLRNDPEVQRLPPLERTDFLKHVSEELGQDWAVWVE